MAEQAQSRKSSEDIIREYFKTRQPNVNVDVVLQVISDLVKRPDFRLFRAGDTMFLIRNYGSGKIEFHMANVEPPVKLVKNAKEFYEAMKKAGFKEAVTKTDNYDMIRIAEMAGIPSQVSNNGRYYTMNVWLA